MSKKSDDKKSVVVLGGGFVGSLLARALSAKLDPAKHDLVLVDQRPFTVNLISSARMTVTKEGNIEELGRIPFDKLFVNGNGSYHRGKAVSIEESKPGAGGSVVLETGEHVPYDVLVLATGSTWPGPLNFPESERFGEHVKEWRKKVADAKDIYIVGGGAVGIEYAGEIRETYPHTKVTIVHSGNMLLSDVYPEKFRKDMERRCLARGINVVFSEYVDTFPEAGTVSFTTRKGTQFATADLVIPAFGARPNTSVAATLGDDVLASDGCVKVRPTLELPGHPGVFAVGDIIHWRECKQAAKGNAHLAVVAANVLSLLAGQPLKKEYKGSIEMIVIPIGKSGGGSYFDVLWGIMLGDWFTRLVKAKDLFVSKARADRGLPS